MSFSLTHIMGMTGTGKTRDCYYSLLEAIKHGAQGVYISMYPHDHCKGIPVVVTHSMDQQQAIVDRILSGESLDIQIPIGDIGEVAAQDIFQSFITNLFEVLPQSSRITIVVDECQYMRDIEQFKEICNPNRGYSYQLVLVHQYLKQLDPIQTACIFDHLTRGIYYQIGTLDQEVIRKMFDLDERQEFLCNLSRQSTQKEPVFVQRG